MATQIHSVVNMSIFCLNTCFLLGIINPVLERTQFSVLRLSNCRVSIVLSRDTQGFDDGRNPREHPLNNLCNVLQLTKR